MEVSPRIIVARNNLTESSVSDRGINQRFHVVFLFNEINLLPFNEIELNPLRGGCKRWTFFLSFFLSFFFFFYEANITFLEERKKEIEHRVNFSSFLFLQSSRASWEARSSAWHRGGRGHRLLWRTRLLWWVKFNSVLLLNRYVVYDNINGKSNVSYHIFHFSRFSLEFIY